MACTDLSENEAKQPAADRNVIFDQEGQREERHRRQVSPPIQVESATWTTAGELDYWVRDGSEWWGRCADQAVITCGSKLLIFDQLRMADSSVGSRSTNRGRMIRAITICNTTPAQRRAQPAPMGRVQPCQHPGVLPGFQASQWDEHRASYGAGL